MLNEFSVNVLPIRERFLKNVEKTDGGKKSNKEFSVHLPINSKDTVTNPFS